MRASFFFVLRDFCFASGCSRAAQRIRIGQSSTQSNASPRQLLLGSSAASFGMCGACSSRPRKRNLLQQHRTFCPQAKRSGQNELQKAQFECFQASAQDVSLAQDLNSNWPLKHTIRQANKQEKGTDENSNQASNAQKQNQVRSDDLTHRHLYEYRLS